MLIYYSAAAYIVLNMALIPLTIAIARQEILETEKLKENNGHLGTRQFYHVGMFQGMWLVLDRQGINSR